MPRASAAEREPNWVILRGVEALQETPVVNAALSLRHEIPCRSYTSVSDRQDPDRIGVFERHAALLTTP
jgi:hypothetical protein